MSWFDDLIEKIGHLWDEFVDFLGWLVNKVVDSIRGWISQIANWLSTDDFVVTTGPESVHISREDFAVQFNAELRKHGKKLVDIQRNGQRVRVLPPGLGRRIEEPRAHGAHDGIREEQWKETGGEEKKVLVVSSG